MDEDECYRYQGDRGSVWFMDGPSKSRCFVTWPYADCKGKTTGNNCPIKGVNIDAFLKWHEPYEEETDLDAGMTGYQGRCYGEERMKIGIDRSFEVKMVRSYLL